MALDPDYPSDDDLARIRTWDVNDCDGLWTFINQIYHWPSCLSIEGGMWRIATGGWSGNEDIVDALHSNRIFTIMCWQRSERGGLHWYKPWKRPAPEGSEQA